MNKGRISTEVDSGIKKDWDVFMMMVHGTIKGPYGKELGIAMRNHMNNHTSVIKPNKDRKITTTTLEYCKTISSGFEMLPDTQIKPITLLPMIKKFTGLIDARSIKKYKDIVLENSKTVHIEDEPFPLLDVEDFCTYVRKVSQDGILDINNKN